MSAKETYDVTVQRLKTPDHELLGPTDTITYRVTGKNPADARKKASASVPKRWGGHWHFIGQDRVEPRESRGPASDDGPVSSAEARRRTDAR